ncbi:la-related protein 1C-like [Nicotiana tabacum]|uniref:La-related protein 1C-like n=1 Tax=Nicotiana tabacum TaxID=4097 RepID=A0A1S4BFR7_TOBAC|nr:PREDICTED: la-related protein 1C-like [Nicotiana tabacum]
MAAPAPTPAHHSHRNTISDTGSSIDAGGLNSPQSRRSSAAARGVSSAWTQIVRSSDSESTVVAISSSPPLPPPLSPPAYSEQTVHSSDCSPSDDVATAGSAATEAQLESSDNGNSDDSNSNVSKKPAWNKPSNGAAEVSPVMGAVCWPALSDSTKASPKSSSSESLKALSDGSVSVTQGTGMASSSHGQANTNNANPNSTLNHVAPTRQRSMKRGGGYSNHNASANGGFSQQQGQSSEAEIVFNKSGKSGNSGADSSSKDNSHRDGGQWGGFGSQSHGGHEHQHQRNSNRRGNVGPHPRGDGTYHLGYGGRRDQERGNQDWKPHRGWGNRDAHMQPQRVPARPFMGGPPHTSPPFIPPTMPVHPYRAPMVYSEVPPVYFFPGPLPDTFRMPMLSPVPPVFFHMPDPQLQTKIVNQIDYYFSNENLIKDTFLRRNMDEHGWVSVMLIAGFKKVMSLTDNIQLILDVMRSSTVVEVQGEKLRRRNDWNHWIIPPSVQNSTISPQSPQKSSPDSLAENLQRVAFDDETIRHGNAEAYLSRPSSAELSTPSKQFGNEMAGKAGAQRGQPMPVGNPI